MSEEIGLFDVTTRTCVRCKVERPLEMFYVELEKRQAARLGRERVRIQCRICQREANQKRLKPRQEYVDTIKVASGCVDCGIRSSHPEIYDFDHLPGRGKVANIAQLIHNGTMDQVEAEIAKCEVVCANCHRIRTRGRDSNAFGVDRGRRA